MYHEYPYKAQIPILIDGKYETRTFTSDSEVWDVIHLLIDETKQEASKGRDYNIAESVMNQLPFFSCKNIIINDKVSQDISRFLYCRQYQISPYKGDYGDQPHKWVQKSFILNNLIEQKKIKTMTSKASQ